MSNTELAKTIKKLAMDANTAAQPDTIIFAKVSKVNPLEVQVNEKIILKEGSQTLIIPKYIRETMKPTDPPTPPYIVPGDKVMLIRTQRGSKFILLDVI